MLSNPERTKMNSHHLSISGIKTRLALFGAVLACIAGVWAPAASATTTSASTSCTAGATGYWAGYWTWSQSTQSWTWTWVWYSCGGGWEIS
jgi:hypothetical protein